MTTHTTRTERPSNGVLDARARDAFPYPMISYTSARLFASLLPAELAQLRARLGRALVLLTDTFGTVNDAEVSPAVDTHAEVWDLLRELETVDTVRCAVLVSDALRVMMSS